jgi:hypothetical protein
VDAAGVRWRKADDTTWCEIGSVAPGAATTASSFMLSHPHSQTVSLVVQHSNAMGDVIEEDYEYTFQSVEKATMKKTRMRLMENREYEIG